jgi:hypothetical protein
MDMKKYLAYILTMLFILQGIAGAETTDIYAFDKTARVTEVSVNTFSCQSSTEGSIPKIWLSTARLEFLYNPAYSPYSSLSKNAQYVQRIDNGMTTYTPINAVPINTAICSGPEAYPTPEIQQYYASLYQEIDDFTIIIPDIYYSLSGMIRIKLLFTGQLDNTVMPPDVRPFLTINGQLLQMESKTTYFVILEVPIGQTIPITIASPPLEPDVPVYMNGMESPPWYYSVQRGFAGIMSVERYL